MWISRISSLGAQAIKKITLGQVRPVTSNYSQASARSTQSMLQPQQKHQYFCTKAPINSNNDGNEEEQTINVTFVETDGMEVHARVAIGTNMLEAALSNDVELEGACEGSCSCSTCHLVVTDMSYYNKLPEPLEEEYDMLDLAFECTPTSRLGCQIIATPEMDGIRFALPSTTANLIVDGFIPKPN